MRAEGGRGSKSKGLRREIKLKQERQSEIKVEQNWIVAFLERCIVSHWLCDAKTLFYVTSPELY